ncbi:FKBP-type peptidyl-prolyl cis-trans isomerase [bacterium]|nr:FKBP-type peptidyl-prolyl cis-trans isomerase [bacterium]
MFFVFTIAGCGDPNGCDSVEQEAEILEYIAAKGWTATATGSGLYYVIDEPGSGIRPDINSEVTVNYSGMLTDGSVFDSGTSTFPLQGVILGWQEGIPLFKKDGKGKLIIPCNLGYGEQTRTGIPSGSILVFDLTLLEVR